MTSTEKNILKTYDKFKKSFTGVHGKLELFTLEEPLFDSIYQALQSITNKYKRDNFYIGITGGKKTMTSAAAIFAYQHKKRYKLLYTDFKTYDAVTNAPKDQDSVFLTEINLELPLLLTIDKQSDKNNIYIFDEKYHYTIFLQNKNRKYAVDKSEVKSFLTLLQTTDLEHIEIYKNYIEEIFKFKKYEEFLSNKFTLFIDESLIKVPFEVSDYFNNLISIKIINSNKKPVIDKKDYISLLYDKTFSNSKLEVEKIKKIAEKFSIPYSMTAIQDIKSMHLVEIFNRSSILHYSGHIDGNGIKVNDGYFDGNNIKFIKDPPKFMFLNGCDSLSGDLLKGIIESDINIALGPILPIPDKIPLKNVTKFYNDFFKNNSLDNLNTFVRNMKKKDLYYRVYYG